MSSDVGRRPGQPPNYESEGRTFESFRARHFRDRFVDLLSNKILQIVLSDATVSKFAAWLIKRKCSFADELQSCNFLGKEA
jgi:hypothetical protein